MDLMLTDTSLKLSTAESNVGLRDRQLENKWPSRLQIKVAAFAAIAASSLTISACMSVGPNTISRDRFDYGQAIADSWEEQMVFNMIRVRYGEAPVFLDVSQVINQYSLEGQVGVQGVIGGVPGVGSDAAGAEGAMRWADRPTITYTPLTGRRFTRNLLTPMSPAAVFAMVESGWPADLVFSVVVRSINGVRNDASHTSLMIVLNLVESDEQDDGPVLTIGTGA